MFQFLLHNAKKMGPQRRLRIYIGFHSPSIIKYLEPLTEDIFIARFADCQFDEIIFPILGGEKKTGKTSNLKCIINILF
jgi:hypothetical protein